MLRRRSTTVIAVIIAVVAVLALVFWLKKQTVPYFSDDSYSPLYIEYYQPDYEWTKSAKEWKGEDAKEVTDLCSDVRDFLNTEFEANLDEKSFTVYLSSVTDEMSNSDKTIVRDAICYKGNIYVEESILKGELNTQTTYMLVHEIIHLLSDTNFCFLFKKADNSICGEFLEEAIVDSLARRYMLENYPNIKLKDLDSGYRYIRLCVDLLQIDIPDLFKYFFEKNIGGLQEEVDKISKKYLVCNGSSFEKFAGMIDEMLLCNELTENRLLAVLEFTIAISSDTQYNEIIERAGEDDIDVRYVKEMMK